jgi:hypothetical protein
VIYVPGRVNQSPRVALTVEFKTGMAPIATCALALDELIDSIPVRLPPAAVAQIAGEKACGVPEVGLCRCPG